MSYPLKGIKVLEMEGLAPTLFAGQILADLGAKVTIIGQEKGNPLSVDISKNILHRGKQSITLDLKEKQDVEQFKKLVSSADILIDAFKPGVMERLGLGPTDCLQINPKIVYARISSYGQNSALSQLAGHDINFLSFSGVLSLLASTGNEGCKEQPPAIPANIVGDFAAGSCLGVIGILAALYEVKRGRQGQVVDLGMAQASLYLSSFMINQKINQSWNQPRGLNVLDGGAHFYNVYQCKDSKYLSVGCIEPKFYQAFINGLRNAGVSNETCTKLEQSQLDMSCWPELKVELGKLFKQKSRDDWYKFFESTEACVSPVYEVHELKDNVNKHLGTSKQPLIICRDLNDPNAFEVSPQPILSNVPSFIGSSKLPLRGEHNYLKPKL